MAAAERAHRAGRLAWRKAAPFVRALRGHRLDVRAMALTYMSLFAVVPALVVVFSIVHAFNGIEALWKGVHDFLLANLAVGARTSIEPYLDRFVRNAHATSAGVVGGAFLLYSAVSLFGHVERAINDIWKVRRMRSLPQRALIYWAGFTLTPFLLAGSLTLAHAVETWLAGSPIGQLAARAGAV